MRANSLKVNKGLSISQAQSISNICNQKAIEIENKYINANNFSKTIKIDDQKYSTQEKVELPSNIVELLLEKSKLHACQAFLMENIKAKDALINQIKKSKVDISHLEAPSRPTYKNAHDNENYQEQVKEEWGWEQLTNAELNEYLEAEAFAAHIGQFIHQNGKLDSLRKELPTIPTIDWMSIETGKKIPVIIEKHSDANKLMEYHDELAKIHRMYEQKVNYFKSKVKNMVTQKNAEIAANNEAILSETEAYNKKLSTEFEFLSNSYSNNISKLENNFNAEKAKLLKEAISMRIEIPDRFKTTIDSMMESIVKEDE